MLGGVRIDNEGGVSLLPTKLSLVGSSVRSGKLVQTPIPIRFKLRRTENSKSGYPYQVPLYLHNMHLTQRDSVQGSGLSRTGDLLYKDQHVHPTCSLTFTWKDYFIVDRLLGNFKTQKIILSSKLLNYFSKENFKYRIIYFQSFLELRGSDSHFLVGYVGYPIRDTTLVLKK